MPYIGGAIREECGLDDSMRTIADVPSRSLLSRLTDHYLQIIANRAPVGFEAEFDNQRGDNDLLSRHPDALLVGRRHDRFHLRRDQLEERRRTPAAGDVPAEDAVRSNSNVEVPIVEPDADTDGDSRASVSRKSRRWRRPDRRPRASDLGGRAARRQCVGRRRGRRRRSSPESKLDEDAGLADRLWAARETAEAVKSADGRTRAALYRALSLAYDFAIAALENPEDYAELLEESGVKAQARAPMTPIVKLVFGIDYDKARLTEFAAALSYAQRRQVGTGGFQQLIEQQPGGLKALVAAEREARRPEPRPDTRGEAARARLRAAPSMSLAEVPAEEEFAVVITRRGADGRHEPVAIVERRGAGRAGNPPARSSFAGLSASGAHGYRRAASYSRSSTRS